MSLTPGTRLGPYDVTAPIGVGGMGEVYRAHDAKLNRDVALKILSDAFVTDPDRLARFHREAQVLASLNHPNIAAIYGFEDSGATHALVLELVEGPTLADRIARGAIPLADALPIAAQIAVALEVAHELGIVHRDLKPANVKVRDDGTVKVLDFGLAKAIDPAASSGVEAMNSPTLTAAAFAAGYGGPGTQMGMILGTAAYMSPEQAKGKSVDKRADIWAFGCVLFEMLSGQRPFKGEDVSDTLAAVLRQDVDWTALPPSTPVSVRRLLARCLERDVKLRLRDIGEARIEFARIQGGDDGTSHVDTKSSGLTFPPFWRRALPWGVAGVTTAALGALLVMWSPWHAPSAPTTVRLSTEIGVDASIDIGVGAATVISPNGQLLVFTAAGSAGPQLFVRRLDQLQATPLQGTAGAYGPFFSADSRSIGFFTAGKLMRTTATGGAPSVVCPASAGRGAAWADDDMIYFTPSTGGSLMRVPASGGAPTLVGSLAEGESTQRFPQVLPGGKAILYSGNNSGTGWEGGKLMIQPLPTGTPRVLLANGFHGRYLAGGREGGHLLYMHQGTIFAVAFDLNRLEITGRPVAVLEGVVASSNTGGAQFSVSDAGTLVYTPGEGTDTKRAMFWMDASGATTPLRTAETDWIGPRFSPDGQRVAVAINDGSQLDVWIYDWKGDAPTKLTVDAANDSYPIWTPSGRGIVFTSDRGTRGTNNLYSQRADSSGTVQRLTDSANTQTAYSFDPSGKFLAFTEVTPTNGVDLMVLPLDGDDERGWKPGKPFVFLATPANEGSPMFSPDGRWIAYQSDEAAQAQVYVRPFPGPGGKHLVSAAGSGVYPAWSRAKSELFFQDPAAKTIMVASYTATGDAFSPDKPRLWSPGKYLEEGQSRVFDVHPDGKRVVIGKPNNDAGQKRGTFVLVFNFAEEIARVMAATAK